MVLLHLEAHSSSAACPFDADLRKDLSFDSVPIVERACHSKCIFQGFVINCWMVSEFKIATGWRDIWGLKRKLGKICFYRALCHTLLLLYLTSESPKFLEFVCWSSSKVLHKPFLPCLSWGWKDTFITSQQYTLLKFNSSPRKRVTFPIGK